MGVGVDQPRQQVAAGDGDLAGRRRRRAGGQQGGDPAAGDGEVARLEPVRSDDNSAAQDEIEHRDTGPGIID